MGIIKLILEAIGLSPDRVLFDNCSSAEGSKIAGIVREMTAKLKELGPSPLKIQSEKE
ncbi:MAG: hydrogenase iron-sulfur subunit [Candidatus Lokiarchaeota archaeon]|nr:hydrogenase iron-sulfur subunit [Candidatus Lokiarchaeota archaeon]